MIIYLKAGNIRLIDLRFQEGCNIPCRAHVRGSIGAVWCQADLEHVVIFQFKILLSRNAHRGVGVQYYNAIMRMPQADLVLGADHTLRLFTANFRFIDLKWFTASWMNSCTYGSHHYFLPFS